MKIANFLTAICLAALLLPLAAGCKSTKIERAQQRSEKLEPTMPINEVYKLMGKPKETFAAVYVWEYYWSGQGSNRLFRVEFEELDGKWVVRNWRWQ
jgi:hypothetical protein